MQSTIIIPSTTRSRTSMHLFDNKTTTKPRSPVFDIAKALMMLWVIWGHLAQYGVVARSSSCFSVWVANAKIGINMPVFFVIGGYLALNALQNGTWAKIAARIICIHWPMAAFGVLFALDAVALGHCFGWRWFAMFPLMRVLHGPWFLRTFTSVFFISALVFKSFHSYKMRLIVFLVIYLSLMFVPIHLRRWLFWIGDEKTVHMLPYFVFGLMALRKRELWKSNVVSIVSGVFFFAVVVFQGNCTTNGMSFWRVSTYWRDVFFNGYNLLTFLGRTAVGLTGSIFLLWMINFFIKLGSSKRGSCLSSILSILATLGTTTLGVYVLHGWPLTVHATRIACVPLPSLMQLPVAIIWLIICHLAIVGIRRVAILRFSFFGDEKRITTMLQHMIN